MSPKLSILNIDVASPHSCLGKLESPGEGEKTLLSKPLSLVPIDRLILFLPFPAILVGPTPIRNRYPSFGVVRLP